MFSVYCILVRPLNLVNLKFGDLHHQIESKDVSHGPYAYYSLFSLVTARSQMYKVDSCVRGHHVFRGIWNSTIGEQLVCKREASNTQHDCQPAVAVMHGATIIERERNPHI